MWTNQERDSSIKGKQTWEKNNRMSPGIKQTIHKYCSWTSSTHMHWRGRVVIINILYNTNIILKVLQFYRRKAFALIKRWKKCCIIYSIYLAEYNHQNTIARIKIPTMNPSQSRQSDTDEDQWSRSTPTYMVHFGSFYNINYFLIKPKSNFISLGEFHRPLIYVHHKRQYYLIPWQKR